jgi:uncharacterized protein
MVAAEVPRFRPLKVVEKIQESQTVASFRLEPLDLTGWRPFAPGQFLVFKIPVADERGHIIRNYSVSSAANAAGAYRITVKREAAPNPRVPSGEGSFYLHDAVSVGDVLIADGPRGAFTLDRSSRRAVALISGGVGLTPLVSMLHALAAQGERKVYFVHACDSGDVHALDREARETAASRPGIVVRVVYRFPTDRDRIDRRYHFEGVITRDLLQEVLPLDDYDVYLCGPPPFMKAVYPILRDLGVARDRIAYEFFGPATVLEVDADRPVEPPTAPLRSTDPARDVSVVTFSRSGKQAVWAENWGSLLDFAESQGIHPPFSCRAGICNTCKTRVIGGQVAYTEEPLDEPESDHALLCCSKPAGPVTLDL